MTSVKIYNGITRPWMHGFRARTRATHPLNPTVTLEQSILWIALSHSYLVFASHLHQDIRALRRPKSLSRFEKPKLPESRLSELMYN